MSFLLSTAKTTQNRLCLLSILTLTKQGGGIGVWYETKSGGNDDLLLSPAGGGITLLICCHANTRRDLLLKHLLVNYHLVLQRATTSIVSQIAQLVRMRSNACMIGMIGMIGISGITFHCHV